MKTELVIALAVALPVILFSAAFVWYLTLGGIHVAIREAKKGVRKTAREQGLRTAWQIWAQ